MLSKSTAYQSVDSRYFALRVERDGVELEQGSQVDDLRTLILLDEELAQSDRYMEVVESMGL